MKKLYLAARSLILWTISGIHFAVVCTFLTFLAIFIDPRRNDLPQRVFFQLRPFSENKNAVWSRACLQKTFPISKR